ncbi:MAG: exonuclease SbcC [Rhodothermales bacterium]|jgi:exonuclease SbcC
MSWTQHIFKPKWQHKNPEIRREAVSHAHDAELLKALPDIASGDEDADTRIAAIRRIDDPGILIVALDSESEQTVLQVLQQRLLMLCASVSTDRPAIKSRMDIVAKSDDRNLLELVACQAPETELRQTALGRINRQGFLGDRAIADPSPEIRKFAAQLITQHSTLRRVIDESRKTDKTLHLELVSRLHQELLDANDPGALKKEALKLCDALEHYALEHMKSVEDIPNEISSAWVRIENHVSAEFLERYQNIAKRLQQVTETNSAPAQEAVVDLEPEPEPQIRPDTDQQSEEDSDNNSPVIPTEVVAPETKIEDDKRVALRAELEEKLKRARLLLEKLEQQLEAGELHNALETRLELVTLGKSVKSKRDWKEITNEVNLHQNRIAELRGWQHWSNDKVRKQLIAEMELLPATGLHPDAVLERVKSLQAQWKTLAASEQIPGEAVFHAAPWMWRKFSLAGNNAFSAAKPFLEKRDEIRERLLQSQKDLCAQLKAATDTEPLDFVSLNSLLQQARKEMRGLDSLPHKIRRSAFSRLRKAIDTGNAAVQAHYGEIEKQKLKLIREATQLARIEDADEAIRTAKRLQSDWKLLGRLWRSRENELWNAFREPIDPLFGKLKESQESEKAEIQQRMDVQESLCKELTDLLTSEDADLQGIQGKIQGIKDAWREIESPNQRLQKKFQSLVENFNRRVADYKSSQVSAIRQHWWAKSLLLHQLETALLKAPIEENFLTQATKDWPDSSDEDIDRLLDQRFKAIIDGDQDISIDPQTGVLASNLCIQLEFLAGLPSPKTEKDARMKYQVDRLSKSLSGDGERISALEEAQNVEQEWLTLPLLSKKNFTALNKRMKTALTEINRNNSV